MERIESVDDLSYYQAWTRDVWTNSIDPEDQMTHALFGLVTEVAEIVDPFKKSRYTPNRSVVVDKEEMTLEIGDVMYYLARVADMQGISLVDALHKNMEKLEKRYGNKSGQSAEGSVDGSSSLVPQESNQADEG